MLDFTVFHDMTFRQIFLPESLLELRGIFRWVPEDVGNIPREFPSSQCSRLCLRHDWEGLESVPLLTLLAVGSFSFVAGGIV